MLDRPSDQVLDCYERAESCRERANSARSAESRQFWLEQEAKWISFASQCGSSARLNSYVNVHNAKSTRAPEEDERARLQGLLSVYQRVCDSLDLDAGDQSLARTIACTVIEAALDGEDDPDALYERVVKTVLAS